MKSRLRYIRPLLAPSVYAMSVLAAYQSARAEAKTFTATSADSLWTQNQNWSPTGAPTSQDNVLISSGGNAISISNVDAVIQNLSFTGTTSRILQNATSATQAALILRTPDGAGNLINVSSVTGTPTFTIRDNGGTGGWLSLYLAGAGNVNVNGASLGDGTTLTINSNVLESLGSRNLIKTGNGIVSLGGVNSFTGNTIAREGFLNLTRTASLPRGLIIGDNTASASTVNVEVNFDSASATYANSITFVENGQTQNKTLSSRVGAATASGTVTIAKNTFFQSTSGSMLIVSGRITGASPGASVNLQNNVGTVLLTNEANDFNDGVTNTLMVQRGTLLLQGNDTAVAGVAGVLGKGTGALVMSGGAEANENAQILTNGAYTIARAVIMNRGAAAETFNTIGGNTAHASTFSGAITLNDGVNTTDRVTAAAGGTVTFSGTIAGSSPNSILTKIGNGTVIFGGSESNTYSGPTVISQGALTAAKPTALGSTANGTTVSSGASLQLSGGISVGAETLSLNGTGISAGGALRNLSGTNSYAGAIFLLGETRINSDASSALILSGRITGTQNLTFGGSGNTTVSGNITTGSGTLTKDGTGSLSLMGTQSYTGFTSVTNGQFIVNGSLVSASISIGSSGVLGGSGAITGSVSVAGTIAPGDSPGTLNTGAQTWLSGGTYLWEINNATGMQGTNWDFVSGAGALDISGLSSSNKFNVNVVGLTAGDVSGAVANWTGASGAWKIASFTSLTGTFGSDLFNINHSGFTNNNSAPGQFTITNVGNDVFLSYSAIPEPATLSFFASGAALAIAAIRRRRR